MPDIEVEVALRRVRFLVAAASVGRFLPRVLAEPLISQAARLVRVEVWTATGNLLGSRRLSVSFEDDGTLDLVSDGPPLG